jgi:hypothetical protein
MWLLGKLEQISEAELVARHAGVFVSAVSTQGGWSAKPRWQIQWSKWSPEKRREKGVYR